MRQLNVENPENQKQYYWLIVDMGMWIWLLMKLTLPES